MKNAYKDDKKWLKIAHKNAQKDGFPVGSIDHKIYVRRFVNAKRKYWIWYEVSKKEPYIYEDYKEKFLRTYSSLIFKDKCWGTFPFCLLANVETDRLVSGKEYNKNDKWSLLFDGLIQLSLLTILCLVLVWLGFFGLACIIWIIGFILHEATN